MDFPHVSAKKMQLIDALMVKEAGIPVLQMMELASLDIALLAKELSKKGKMAILCGKGNNGGDGITAARHLSNFGFSPLIILPFPKKSLKGIPKHQLEIVKKMGIPILSMPKDRKRISREIRKSGLIIDSLIGYNLKGNPRKHFAELIEMANSSKKKVLAVDIASGLDATTGKAFKPCIKANYSLALTLPKTGMFKGEGKRASGKIFVGYLSIPGRIFLKAGIKPKNWFKGKLVVKA